MKTKPPPRNTEAQCPSCGNQKLYHDFWDECFNCGWGIDDHAEVSAPANDGESHRHGRY